MHVTRPYKWKWEVIKLNHFVFPNSLSLFSTWSRLNSTRFYCIPAPLYQCYNLFLFQLKFLAFEVVFTVHEEKIKKEKKISKKKKEIGFSSYLRNFQSFQSQRILLRPKYLNSMTRIQNQDKNSTVDWEYRVSFAPKYPYSHLFHLR